MAGKGGYGVKRMHARSNAPAVKQLPVNTDGTHNYLGEHKNVFGEGVTKKPMATKVPRTKLARPDTDNDID